MFFRFCRWASVDEDRESGTPMSSQHRQADVPKVHPHRDEPSASLSNLSSQHQAAAVAAAAATTRKHDAGGDDSMAPGTDVSGSAGSSLHNSQQHPTSAGGEAAPWVNTGYQTWLERRKEWTSGTPATSASKRPKPQRYRAPVDCETILSTAQFPTPIPLEDVVECLVELWEEYGNDY